jgi:hypothetical protein
MFRINYISNKYVLTGYLKNLKLTQCLNME